MNDNNPAMSKAVDEVALETTMFGAAAAGISGATRNRSDTAALQTELGDYKFLVQ